MPPCLVPSGGRQVASPRAQAWLGAHSAPGGSRQDWEPGGGGAMAPGGGFGLQPKDRGTQLNHFPRKAQQLESRQGSAASPPGLEQGWISDWQGQPPLGAEAAEPERRSLVGCRPRGCEELD